MMAVYVALLAALTRTNINLDCIVAGLVSVTTLAVVTDNGIDSISRVCIPDRFGFADRNQFISRRDR
jgi:ABC-type proline/glycine betaine transport system permease subunit